MHEALTQSNNLDTFKSYTPSPKTGYAFDNSALIVDLKKAVKNTGHSPASFVLSCKRLKASLLE